MNHTGTPPEMVNIPEKYKRDAIIPAYYTKKIWDTCISCYDVIELITQDFNDPFEAFLLGNVVKYIWRYKRKNGLQDLMKAQEYLSQIIVRLGKGEPICRNPTEDGTTHTD